MRVVRNLGFILLSSWLILSALFSLLNINWPISSVVLSLLAIAAGILVLLSVVVGPSVPIGGLGTPQQYIGTECIPVGDTRPTGARIKIMAPDPNGPGRITIHFWDYSCDDLATLIQELNRINLQFCQQGNGNTLPATIGGITINPFQSTTTGTVGITMSGPNGNFLFPCSAVPELIRAAGQAFSGCCL